jgi:hypothetical protein
MKLSIVILSYNVKDLLRRALQSIYSTYKGNDFQIVVVDNASSDGSLAMVRKEFPRVHLISSRRNVGFSKGNNLARPVVRGDVVLFLNPDTEFKEDAIGKCLEILSRNKELAAITCKVVLPDGSLDYSCHRGLPTVWNTLSYWLGLSNLFPKSPVFSGYEAKYLDINTSHYIECISGSFFMVRRSVLEKVGWWDEDYWWNGEDIELCYRLKSAGYKIWYESSVSMIHYKGSSSGLWRTSKTEVSKKIKEKSAISSTRAMSIFVRKHWRELGPWPVMYLVRFGIFLLEVYRLSVIRMGRLYK